MMCTEYVSLRNTTTQRLEIKVGAIVCWLNLDLISRFPVGDQFSLNADIISRFHEDTHDLYSKYSIWAMKLIFCISVCDI